jgi:hypothetical protein
MEEFAGAKFKVEVPAKPVAKRERNTPMRVDLLDSWAHLPGSFEHGKL